MRAFTHWKWRLDEVYVKISGEMHYLWRAVDHEGEVLESYVTITRDKAAALAFIKKAMKRHGSAKVVTTDGLRPYKAAIKEIAAADRQEVGRSAASFHYHSTKTVTSSAAKTTRLAAPPPGGAETARRLINLGRGGLRHWRLIAISLNTQESRPVWGWRRFGEASITMSGFS